MMHNTSISPSPARLGLSVPHSPALATPGSLPPPPSSQKISQRTTPLSNLPPHRRAQLLLQEMAGLTARIFEVSSNKASWLTAYRGSIPTFLPGSSIPPEGAAATTSKDILAILGSHQALLSEAMGELQELQEIEEEKQRVARDIASKDSAMRVFAKGLRDAEQVLEQTLEEYEDYTKGKRRKTGEAIANSSPDVVGLGDLELSDLLTYAHRISYTTFAPPEFGSNQAPLRGAMPPAPQEEQMRASQLYQFADLDVGIPKQAISEQIPVAIMEPDPETNVENPLMGVPGLPMPPTMPAGWRPGMPIELPGGLPLVPPGWKPGDPVPLPPVMEIPAGWKPGDAVVLPKPEEPAPAPVPAPPKSVAPAGANAEPIQVRYVQLDINPDMQDEYSSEYSSEEGSSEEEDED
eukprot:Gb_12525 [translate_table: standard]